MTGRFVRTLVAIGALFALPAVMYAQEAVLTGTVTDSGREVKYDRTEKPRAGQGSRGRHDRAVRPCPVSR